MSTFTLVYDDCPKSVNQGGGGARKNKYSSHREKMMWEGIYGMMLIAGKVPRNLGHTRVTIELKFKAKRNRDAENYRHPVIKPLLDAMKKGGWLIDDTEQYVEVERVYLVEGTLEHPNPRVESQMVVTLQVADEIA